MTCLSKHGMASCVRILEKGLLNRKTKFGKRGFNSMIETLVVKELCLQLSKMLAKEMLKYKGVWT